MNQFPPHVLQLLNDLQENLIAQAFYLVHGTPEWDEELKRGIKFEHGKHINKAIEEMKDLQRPIILKKLVEQEMVSLQKEIANQRNKEIAAAHKLLLNKIRGGGEEKSQIFPQTK